MMREKLRVRKGFWVPDDIFKNLRQTRITTCYCWGPIVIKTLKPILYYENTYKYSLLKYKIPQFDFLCQLSLMKLLRKYQKVLSRTNCFLLCWCDLKTHYDVFVVVQPACIGVAYTRRRLILMRDQVLPGKNPGAFNVKAMKIGHPRTLKLLTWSGQTATEQNMIVKLRFQIIREKNLETKIEAHYLERCKIKHFWSIFRLI